MKRPIQVDYSHWVASYLNNSRVLKWYSYSAKLYLLGNLPKWLIYIHTFHAGSGMEGGLLVWLASLLEITFLGSLEKLSNYKHHNLAIQWRTWQWEWQEECNYLNIHPPYMKEHTKYPVVMQLATCSPFLITFICTLLRHSVVFDIILCSLLM